MVKLSRRLSVIADGIKKSEIVADIGTDHGLLPIFLWENEISPKVVLIDINEGPLEKARENMEKHLPGCPMDIRLGSGIEPLQTGEVDTVVIAGMGGLLMIDILEHNLEKTMSFSTYILQPRNAPEKLRKWLLLQGFTIKNETIVKEGRFLCEVLEAKTPNRTPEVFEFSESHSSGEWLSNHGLSETKNWEMEKNLDLEIAPLLFEKRDPLLLDFIKNKIRIEKKIEAELLNAKEGRESDQREKRLQMIRERIEKLKQKWEEAYEYRDEQSPSGIK